MLISRRRLARTCTTINYLSGLLALRIELLVLLAADSTIAVHCQSRALVLGILLRQVASSVSLAWRARVRLVDQVGGRLLLLLLVAMMIAIGLAGRRWRRRIGVDCAFKQV